MIKRIFLHYYKFLKNNQKNYYFMYIYKFLKKHRASQPITMVTAYDYPAVVHLETAGVDICLVGDSAAMVVHGHHTTLPITLEEMLVHCRAGARGAKTPLLVGDLAFGIYESSSNQVMLVRLWCLCLIVSLVG